ncbi:HNH endonuclease [Gordonia phage EricDab]|uniref:HNH endonuclease n=1 Tax=Gordonia phage EricDab TaxID=3070616 RepID=A0A4D6E579_9CAUD|nr:HNH endonuclease [Gordonia phage EricDab]QBZ73195.1 HNH endonuclease [Gordonia phage EricDab]
MSLGSRPWRRMVALTLATFGTTCHLCGRPGATSADHLIPRSKGGLHVLSNLRPAHPSCNSMRQDMDLDEWFARHPLPESEIDAAEPSREW